MDTNTINRIREHESAKELMNQHDFLRALDVLRKAGSEYGFNVQLTFDLADCYRKTADFQNYVGAVHAISGLQSNSLHNSTSQVVAQFMAAKNQLHSLEVSSALQMLSRLVWLPGINAELRTQILVDQVLLATIFNEPLDWSNIDLFHEKNPNSLELNLVIALAKGNLSEVSVDTDQPIDVILLERLIHAEHIVHETHFIRDLLAQQIRQSDVQYLNSLINTNIERMDMISGLASYSKFDFVLRQLYQTDMTKISLQNVVAQTQQLEPGSQRMWRKLTTQKNQDIIKLVVDLDNHVITSSLGEMDLNRKRIHLRFFSEFATKNEISLDDLAYDVWNQRYDEKVYNRIRIFLQRVNRELFPVTGQTKIFQLESPVVRLVGDVQIFVKSEEFDGVME